MFKSFPVREKIHSTIHWLSLCLMAIGLPLSMFLMSISSIILLGNWLSRGELKSQWKAFTSNKPAWVFSLIFLMHLVGVCYSNDMNFALDDLRIKLPLLIYPIVLGSTAKITEKQFKATMWVFVSALTLSSLVSMAIYLGWTNRELQDFRGISPFISHIRLSLLLCVGIIWLALEGNREARLGLKLAFWSLALWFFFLMGLLQSVTGIGIILMLIVLVLLKKTLSIHSIILKVSCFLIVLLTIPCFIGYYTWDYFKSKDKIVVADLDLYSAQGSPYLHNPEITITENGHRVFLYTVYQEIENEWPKRSNKSLQEPLKNGSNLEAVLIRYLTSKNLRKDSIGIWALSEADISAIEKGVTNYKHPQSGIKRRFHGIFKEIDNYRNGTVNGNSAMQRLEYNKTGLQIIANNFWFGVGTGDLKLAFKKQYEEENSTLEEKYRLRAHNQYLSIWIAFGFIGFALFMVGIIYPIKLVKAYKDPVFIGFIIVALASFIGEDTLETQAGVSFFIFFYGLFLWARDQSLTNFSPN